MSYYRVSLDVPVQLVIKISALLRKHREELGIRSGTRALTCWQQAKFILAWFRDKPDIRRLGHGLRDLPGHRLPLQGRGNRNAQGAGADPARGPRKRR